MKGKVQREADDGEKGRARKAKVRRKKDPYVSSPSM
jgi:hypothetical protein